MTKIEQLTTDLQNATALAQAQIADAQQLSVDNPKAFWEMVHLHTIKITQLQYANAVARFAQGVTFYLGTMTGTIEKQSEELTILRQLYSHLKNGTGNEEEVKRILGEMVELEAKTAQQVKKGN